MRWGFTIVSLLVSTCALPARAADDLGPVRDAAVRLYDQGLYDQACTALHQLDDAKALDGPLLYRLFYCEKAAGHEDESKKALERARASLESQIAAARSLEDAFYLANAYANLGRPEDARTASREATARVESKQVAIPTTAIGLFQLGKLYQDQGRQTEAAKYFAQAVESFDLTDGRYAGNARWALRFLGNAAYSRRDFVASEASFAKLTALGGADPGDWESLAAARVRLGKYPGASEAWKALVRLDPANSDDARYAARVADTAGTIAPLPEGTPAYASMSRPDLEAFLKAQAQAALAVQSRIAAAMEQNAEGRPVKAIDPKLRIELSQSLRETRRQFIAAALEHAVKQYGIRETAFREGYAVLIFQDRAWEVPPDPEAEAEGS